MRLERASSSSDRAPTGWPLRIEIEPVLRKEWPALLVIGTFALVMVVGIAGRWIGYDGAELNRAFGLFVALWVIGHLAQSAQARLLSDLCKLLAVFCLLALTAPLASAVLAGTEFPLADTRLAQADGWLIPGFSWPAMAHIVNQYPQLMKALSYAYVSLGYQPLLLIVILCLLKRSHLGWSFMSCWAGTLLISIAIFPLLPAVGAYAHFGIADTMMPTVLCGSAWHYPVTLQHLRDGTINALGPDALEGIVTMPSFHAASAVLLAWAYGKIRYVRWPFLALNLVMWISAIPIGGHYLVDVLAGTGIALSAVIAVERRARRTNAPPPSPASPLLGQAAIGLVPHPT